MTKVMTDREREREKFGGGNPPAQECTVTLWECVPLGTCLIGGGRLTHALCKQAHMAIITLIFGGGLGETREDRAGGASLKRKMGMERARRSGARGSSHLRMYVYNSHRVLPASVESMLKHLSVMSLFLRAALSREAALHTTHVWLGVWGKKEQAAELFTVFGGTPHSQSGGSTNWKTQARLQKHPLAEAQFPPKIRGYSARLLPCVLAQLWPPLSRCQWDSLSCDK